MDNFNELFENTQGHPENLELIDFEISQFWQNHFYEIGYSRYKPPSPKRRAAVAEQKKLSHDFGHLAIEVTGLHAKCEGLTRKVSALSKEVENLKSCPPTNLVGRSTGVPVEDLE